MKYPVIRKNEIYFSFSKMKRTILRQTCHFSFTRHRSALKISFCVDVERNNCISFPNGSNVYRYIPIYCQHHPVARLSYLLTCIN